MERTNDTNGHGLSAHERTGDAQPASSSAFGAHLGGVSSVMLVAWDKEESGFLSVALRFANRTPRGELIFELPNAEWGPLLDREWGSVCLTAQVADRFVSVEAQVTDIGTGPRPRLVMMPTTQTFWDTVSGRIARVTSGLVTRGDRLPARSTPTLQGNEEVDVTPNGEMMNGS